MAQHPRGNQQHQHQQLDEQVSFHLRQPLPPSPFVNTPASVSMRRGSYDDLVARNPDATLTYVDDDDGEHVTVGTSFELLQRVQEPLPPHRLDRLPPPPFHMFDIRDSAAVRRVWQPYVDRYPWATSQTSQRVHQPISSVASGSLTPAGEQQVREAAATLKRASKTPPHLAAGHQESSPHANRWVSYSTLPASFSPPPPAEQPRADVEETTPARLSSGSAPSEAKPLLALFEAELAKLTATATATDTTTGPMPPSTGGPTSTNAPPSTASTAAQTQPNYQSSQTQTAPTTGATSRDILGNSMKTLQEGLGMLKTTTSDMNQELRQLATAVPRDFLDLFKSQLHTQQNNIAAAETRFVANTQKRYVEQRQKVQRLVADLNAFLDGDEAAPDPSTDHSSAHEFPTSVPPEVAQLTVTLPKGKDSKTAQCDERCLQGCSLAACPVRILVKGAYERLVPQEPSSQADEAAVVPPHFKVDTLLARRYITYDSLVGPRKKQYLVRWVGYGPEADVWYDVESLVHCEELVVKYDADHPESESTPSVPHPQSREESLHIAHLHSRAADRMVTFQPQAAGRQTREQDSALGFGASAEQGSALDGSKADKSVQDNARTGSSTLKPKPVWAGQSHAERVKPLRHQRSWHPSSKTVQPHVDTDSFDFSPIAVMERYPPVALVSSTATRPGDLPGHRSDFTSADAPTKPPKGVSFAESTGHSFAGRTPEATSADSTTDPSLYAPPSPVIPALRRQSTEATRQTSSSDRDTSESMLRRAKSLNLRSASTQQADERTRDRRDRFRPYADPRVRGAPRPSTEYPGYTVPPRRANTTASAHPSTRPTGIPTSTGPSHRDEGRTRRENISYCHYRLVQMGFPREEALIVSEAMSGDLESSLDVLNEEHRARAELAKDRRQSAPSGRQSGMSRMPGAFTWG